MAGQLAGCTQRWGGDGNQLLGHTVQGDRKEMHDQLVVAWIQTVS